MSKYKHLFFDLDHTLWDFETNSKEALSEIFQNNDLEIRTQVSFDKFLEKYYVINDEMWDLYRKDEISKVQLRDDRFYNTLLEFGVDDRALSKEIGKFYVKTSPYKTNLFEGCHELLTQLQEEFELHIITNGFEEVQFIKLDCCGLTPYFNEIITSEKAGYKKPEPQIFQYALDKSGSKIEESLMIGDGVETDILGANKFGMDQLYFDPHKVGKKVKATYRVEHLLEILDVIK